MAASQQSQQSLLLARVQQLDGAHALEVCGWLLSQVRRAGCVARRRPQYGCPQGSHGDVSGVCTRVRPRAPRSARIPRNPIRLRARSPRLRRRGGLERTRRADTSHATTGLATCGG
jgi:hypothetical protein